MRELENIAAASMFEKKLKEIATPYNFIQFNLRSKIVDYYYKNQVFIFESPSLAPLANSFTGLIDEILQKEPYDIRMFIRKAQMLQSMGQNNPELYKQSEEAMRKAIEISPTRQELYYNLAFSLLGQNRFQESIKIAKEAIELSPNVARAHYHLAFVMAAAGPQYKEEVMKEMEIADNLSPDLGTLQAGDQNIIAFIYSRFGRFDKVAEIVLRNINKSLGVVFLQTYYENALSYYLTVRDADNFLMVAKKMRDQFTQLQDDLDILIDLAEKENWEIINNLGK